MLSSKYGIKVTGHPLHRKINYHVQFKRKKKQHNARVLGCGRVF
jgi:hypothetical protein